MGGQLSGEALTVAPGAAGVPEPDAECAEPVEWLRSLPEDLPSRLAIMMRECRSGERGAPHTAAGTAPAAGGERAAGRRGARGVAARRVEVGGARTEPAVPRPSTPGLATEHAPEPSGTVQVSADRLLTPPPELAHTQVAPSTTTAVSTTTTTTTIPNPVAATPPPDPNAAHDVPWNELPAAIRALIVSRASNSSCQGGDKGVLTAASPHAADGLVAWGGHVVAVGAHLYAFTNAARLVVTVARSDGVVLGQWWRPGALLAIHGLGHVAPDHLAVMWFDTEARGCLSLVPLPRRAWTRACHQRYSTRAFRDTVRAVLMLALTHRDDGADGAPETRARAALHTWGRLPPEVLEYWIACAWAAWPALDGP